MDTRNAIHLLLAASFVLLLSSCAKTSVPPKGPLEPISNLRAFSADSTSVGLAWTPSPSASTPDFGDYLVNATPEDQIGGVILTKSAGSNSSLRFGGLMPSSVYTFAVIARPNSSSSAGNSTPLSVVWAPASRFDSVSGQPILVYESSSTSGNAALIFYSSVTGGPRTVNLLNPSTPSDTAEVDLFVRTETITSVSIRSADLYLTPDGTMRFPRTTLFSSFSYSAGNLDDAELRPPDTSSYAPTNTVIEIDTTAAVTSTIFYFRSNDAHYGRLLVRRDPTSGTMIWGTSPDRYLVVELSYQPVPANIYSRRSQQEGE